MIDPYEYHIADEMKRARTPDKTMTAETDLLPLPEPVPFDGKTLGDRMRDYARANLAELQREVEGLRALAERRRILLAEVTGAGMADRARAQRLAEALRDAREYVVSELADERAKFAGYEHCSTIASIEADLTKIDAALDQETTNG